MRQVLVDVGVLRLTRCRLCW